MLFALGLMLTVLSVLALFVLVPKETIARWLLFAAVGEKVVPTAAPLPAFRNAIVSALTDRFTWTWWLVLCGAVGLYSVNLLLFSTLVSLPLGLWMLCVLFLRAEQIAKEKSSKKKAEQRPHPYLLLLTTITFRIAFLSTLGVIMYYALFAPPGTWQGVSADIGQSSEAVIIPGGLPLNPNFTSRQLENWSVAYVAANPQYNVAQTAWGGKNLTILKEPGREVTDAVNLTLGFGPGVESLNIHLEGACAATLDNRRPQISKTCAGWWKDQGGQISGQFYLQVNEGGSSRYFDAYLFDGNYLPKKSQLQMMLYGPPIPAIMLQFRPKDWSRQ